MEKDVFLILFDRITLINDSKNFVKVIFLCWNIYTDCDVFLTVDKMMYILNKHFAFASNDNY